MFGEAWSPMSVPDLAPDDDDDEPRFYKFGVWGQRKPTSTCGTMGNEERERGVEGRGEVNGVCVCERACCIC